MSFRQMSTLSYGSKPANRRVDARKASEITSLKHSEMKKLNILRREENLNKEIRNLEMSWKKLKENIEDLEYEKLQLSRFQIGKDDSENMQNEYLSDEQSMLIKCQDDLRKLLQLSEIDTRNIYESFQGLEKPSETRYDDIRNSSSDLSQRMKRIKELIDKINIHVKPRENEVLQLEAVAQEHQSSIMDIHDRKSSILKERDQMAKDREQLILDIKDTQRQNAKLLREKDENKNKLNLALEEKQRLDQTERQLLLDEARLKNLEDDYEEKKKYFIHKYAKEAQSDDIHIINRYVMEKLKKVLEQNAIRDEILDQEAEIQKMKQELNNKELNMVEREAQFRAAEEAFQQDFIDARNDLKSSINELERIIPLLNEDIQRLQDRITNSEFDTRSRRIHELNRLLVNDSEITARYDELKKQLDELIKQENQLIRDEREATNQLEALEAEEDDLNFQVESLQNEKKLLATRLLTVEKNLAIMEQEYISSKARLAALNELNDKASDPQ